MLGTVTLVAEVLPWKKLAEGLKQDSLKGGPSNGDGNTLVGLMQDSRKP